MAEPLILRPEDSGTRECPVTYTASPGEKPVISGGVQLLQWEPHEGAILRCALRKKARRKWPFRQSRAPAG